MSDPFDGDRPVFDPKCPSCGRFWKRSTGAFTFNGFGDILKTEGVCARCGDIEPGIVCWQSDLEAVRA